MQRYRQLTHFTKTEASLLNILEHGFAWMRNDRIVIRFLLPEFNASVREPQSFGQICFTENTPASNRNHADHFGPYGIQVSYEWAEKHKMQPVIYISDTGPALDALSFLFKQTFQKSIAGELYPDDLARQQWMVSAPMAKVTGKPLYAALLELYQYMEPANHSAQREWRIVNPDPDWSISKSKEEAVKNVSPPKGWATVTSVVPIEPEDIVALICQKQDVNNLSLSLHQKFREVPIQTY